METTVPAWGLMLAYWVHMLATVLWIGGLSALALIVLPAAHGAVQGGAYTLFLERLERRLQAVGWFSLAALGLTGMFQMSASPNYGGFLAINSLWASAIFVKHIAIGVMVVISAVMTWGVMPGLRRMAMLETAGKNVDETERDRLHRRQSALLRWNLAASVLVLALTAIARAS